mmetsp:Transcript_5720/g.13184  ORF Transcript_5720/g.13184 Transcript_5720/m.13184 type:complete len:211 (+) Transcript_5720:576-1208(+)
MSVSEDSLIRAMQSSARLRLLTSSMAVPMEPGTFVMRSDRSGVRVGNSTTCISRRNSCSTCPSAGSVPLVNSRNTSTKSSVATALSSCLPFAEEVGRDVGERCAAALVGVAAFRRLGARWAAGRRGGEGTGVCGDGPWCGTGTFRHKSSIDTSGTFRTKSNKGADGVTSPIASAGGSSKSLHPCRISSCASSAASPGAGLSMPAAFTAFR